MRVCFPYLIHVRFCVLTEYIVEFEDQEAKGDWEELKRVVGNKESTRLSLWPYMFYRFRVIAINEVGKSDPSKPSEIYNTPAEGQCDGCFNFDLF